MDDGGQRAAESRRGRDQRMKSTRPDPRDRSGLQLVTRRHFFDQASFGIGGLALASLMDGVLHAEAPGSAPPTSLQSYVAGLHFAPKVKRVIYLFMAGAPSQIDLFDPKPALTRHDGEDIPEE